MKWIKDDAVHFNMDRLCIAPLHRPSTVLEVFTREFDGVHLDSDLFLLTMHCCIVGHRSRMWLLEELTRRVRGHDGVWFVTHAAIAR